jgi:surface antigen
MRRALPLALAAGLALASAGCSLSYQLDSLFEKRADNAAVEQTGSTAISAEAAQDAGGPGEGDLVLARAAAEDVLARGGKGAAAWENPLTGARGTVTPIAAAYTVDGHLCRDFLASYVRAGTEAWLQGEACRADEGRWQVRAFKPWKRS